MHKIVHIGTDNRIVNHRVPELPVGTFTKTHPPISFWAPFQTPASIVSVLELLLAV
ncbi:hypothetical protein IscW_ISCW002292 [Ixodes scapularis]|uniref:Uncharacterized protein n=1 Tax=Ixodes scapularis TaxID=6945 RepID=B7PCX9_IXOSC|nr:hypothetical protein IscW_ISCW002292 [Ixodes scapularis]|eukprot:XP_002410432.1 hypothetical protein IscW_ISCW002292 [Ixodes scapularis]